MFINIKTKRSGLQRYVFTRSNMSVLMFINIHLYLNISSHTSILKHIESQGRVPPFSMTHAPIRKVVYLHSQWHMHPFARSCTSILNDTCTHSQGRVPPFSRSYISILGWHYVTDVSRFLRYQILILNVRHIYSHGQIIHFQGHTYLFAK